MVLYFFSLSFASPCSSQSWAVKLKRKVSTAIKFFKQHCYELFDDDFRYLPASKKLMTIKIIPSNISGHIAAPASKSSMQRACAAALVRRDESIIHNPGISNDDKSALGVIESLGATVEYLKDGSLKINSSNFLSISQIPSPEARRVAVGESGLGIRMFTPIIALNKDEITINGEGSLLTRPMDFFDEILPQLGVQISSNKGKLPLKINGPLQPKNITVDGSLSSQFLTGLLLAYAALNANDVTITVENLKSKPYIDLTLKVMKDFGLPVPLNNNYEAFIFTCKPINQLTNQPINYTVEGDWSGGAFLLVAGAVAGNISIHGLDINSAQADKKIMEALKDAGADIILGDDEIQISNPLSGLKPFHFDATDCPDLFPPLAALAAYCKGTTFIKGVKRLAHKESDRALTIQEEMGKMGLHVELHDDMMHIHGGMALNGANVHSHHDHRIAMMCAVAALQAKRETEIDCAEAVNKSYPMFWKHISTLKRSY